MFIRYFIANGVKLNFFLGISAGPEFITVPWVTRVSEDTAPGSAIVQVKAIDGDHGINAPISYGLAGDHLDYFVIEPTDGTVYLAERLDREHPNVTNSGLVITVIVTFTFTIRFESISELNY